MTTSYDLDRQAIVNRVYTHFIVNKEKAGRESGNRCVFHGEDENGHAVACAIGIFDESHYLDDPYRGWSVCDLAADTLSNVFGRELTIDDINFLGCIQAEHDLAVLYAFYADKDDHQGFDTHFITDLDRRLLRFAQEFSLNPPSTH